MGKSKAKQAAAESRQAKSNKTIKVKTEPSGEARADSPKVSTPSSKAAHAKVEPTYHVHDHQSYIKIEIKSGIGASLKGESSIQDEALLDLGKQVPGPIVQHCALCHKDYTEAEAGNCKCEHNEEEVDWFYPVDKGDYHLWTGACVNCDKMFTLRGDENGPSELMEGYCYIGHHVADEEKAELIMEEWRDASRAARRLEYAAETSSTTTSATNTRPHTRRNDTYRYYENHIDNCYTDEALEYADVMEQTERYSYHPYYDNW